MERIDEAHRVVPASPEAVYAALTDARARASWLPPTGMTATVEWFDARPGGGYRMVLAYDDVAQRGKSGDNRDVVEVRFVELLAPRRVVEAAGFVSDDPDLAGTMTMTWTVEPHPDGSLVAIEARDVPPGIDRREHLTAFASSLDHLAEHVGPPGSRGDAVAGEE
ncbi:SRPBCC domain-containing protein [Nocardioides sp. Soil805]|uniref:SRPBCC domain-containing protein n=1 Tax=Nocardioides sp. Soil805 TaxID=1736416 RepID=UPI0007026343|nr:SRPBCC domain-containing protein [Nocardioides sp. Soil805]KRF30591.1 ATPase [Nocardioides sp. Soil805]